MADPGQTVRLTASACGKTSRVDTNDYLTFLFLGALLVVIDGQIIYRSGKRLLRQSGGEGAGAEPMTRLIVVLFHLVGLGVLFLGSTISSDDWGSVTGVVGRLGLLLLFLALAHGVATAALSNVRDAEASRARRAAQRQAGSGELSEPPVAPVPGQEGRSPWVTPSLEDREPYTTSEG